MLPAGVRRRWYRLLGAGPVLLLLAFLPSLLYAGHWAEFLHHGVGAEARTEEEAGEEQAAHHAHCHAGTASCSQQPALASLRVLPEVVELPAPPLQLRRLEERTRTWSEFVARPPTEPPRA